MSAPMLIPILTTVIGAVATRMLTPKPPKPPPAAVSTVPAQKSLTDDQADAASAEAKRKQSLLASVTKGKKSLLTGPAGAQGIPGPYDPASLGTKLGSSPTLGTTA